MRFAVAQLGARMHYAVPRIFHDAGMLERFYTDICAVKGWPRLLHMVPGMLRPTRLKRLLGRVPKGIPRGRITAFTRFGWEYAVRGAKARTPTETTATWLWAGKTFCELVIREGLGDADSVYTFCSAGLELLRFARQRGVKAVVEQTIAPYDVVRRLINEEQEAYPNWEPPLETNELGGEFSARERAEWDEADLIVCGSEFVREGVVSCGGPKERCVVVPYGVDSAFFVPERRLHDGPLRVLTVGAVGLRKGSPYVLAAAKLMGRRARFRMVGGTRIRKNAVDDLRKHVEVIGTAPRTEMPAHYAWADVFLLPSICEGSATVCYEALASGLPVICTPNTGSVVRDGTDGFIVPIRDPEAIVEKLELLQAQPELRRTMSENARARAGEFDLDAYGVRLLALAKRLHQAQGVSRRRFATEAGGQG